MNERQFKALKKQLQTSPLTLLQRKELKKLIGCSAEHDMDSILSAEEQRFISEMLSENAVQVKYGKCAMAQYLRG